MLNLDRLLSTMWLRVASLPFLWLEVDNLIATLILRKYMFAPKLTSNAAFKLCSVMLTFIGSILAIILILIDRKHKATLSAQSHDTVT